MTHATADLHDAYAVELQVAEPLFRDLGARTAFHGPIATVEAPEDNKLAALAHESGWAGVVIHGCIRDAAIVATIDIGVKALATCPVKSDRQGRGRRDVELRFAGVRFVPGHHLYADSDGILVATRALPPLG